METKFEWIISACDVILDEGTMKDVRRRSRSRRKWKLEKYL